MKLYIMQSFKGSFQLYNNSFVENNVNIFVFLSDLSSDKKIWLIYKQNLKQFMSLALFNGKISVLEIMQICAYLIRQSLICISKHSIPENL